jgi:hypothetical protein
MAMPSWSTRLKTGKTLTQPSHFLKASFADCKLLRQTVLGYPEEDTSEIAGFVLSLKDWHLSGGELYPEPVVDDPPKFTQRIKIIDPELHILFVGFKQDKEDLLNTKIGGTKIGDTRSTFREPNLKAAIESIQTLPRNEKITQSIQRIYPYLDGLNSPLLKHQIDNRCDIVVIPSVPITSRKFAPKQIEKARSMILDSRVLLDTTYQSQLDKRDFMVMLTANVGILQSEYAEELVSMLSYFHFDHIGLKLLNMNPSDSGNVLTVLRFIRDLRENLKGRRLNVPIHIFNTREFGYVTYCHGATSIVTPIATAPYIHLDRENPPDPVPIGKYYHPVDMTDDTYETLCEKTLPHDFRLPCHCKICQEMETVTKAKDTFNPFRRVHFVQAKNLEMIEIRRADPEALQVGLKNRFANSMNMAWVPYLDRMIVPFA